MRRERAIISFLPLLIVATLALDSQKILSAQPPIPAAGDDRKQKHSSDFIAANAKFSAIPFQAIIAGNIPDKSKVNVVGLLGEVTRDQQDGRRDGYWLFQDKDSFDNKVTANAIFLNDVELSDGFSRDMNGKYVRIFGTLRDWTPAVGLGDYCFSIATEAVTKKI